MYNKSKYELFNPINKKREREREREIGGSTSSHVNFIHPFIKLAILDLESASETRRGCLPTSDKELKSEWNKDVEVQNLELQSGAQAHCCLKLHQPLQHWAALVDDRVTKANVHQPAKKIHTSSKLKSVDWARGGWWWQARQARLRWWWRARLSCWRVSHRRNCHWGEGLDWRENPWREGDGWVHNWR